MIRERYSGPDYILYWFELMKHFLLIERRKTIAAFFAAWMLCAFAVEAQKPNLYEAVAIWEGKANGLNLTLWQIPERSSTHIPLRFIVQAEKDESASGSKKSESDSGNSILNEFSSVEGENANICVDCPPEMIPELAKINESGKPALKSLDLEITAVEGPEATLIYSPNRQYMRRWEQGMVEARETFRTPGTYRLRIMPEGSDQTFFETTIVVDAYQNLNFTSEIGFFIGGCLIVGGFLLVALWVLRKNTIPATSHHVT